MRRLYSPLQVGLATFFGGPLAMAFLLAANFSALRQRMNALLSVLGTVAFVGAWILVFTHFPRLGFVPPALLEAIGVYAIVSRFQIPRLGDAAQSNGRVVAVTLGAIAMSLLLFVAALVAMLATSGFRT